MTTALLACVAFALGVGWARGTGAPAPADGWSAAVPDPSFDSERPDAEQGTPVGGESQSPSKKSAGQTLKEILAAAGRVAALKAALEELNPVDELWPDLVPADLVPGTFEDHVESAIKAVGRGELQALDCEEYPCVATLGLPDADPELTPAERLGELMEVRAELEAYLDMPMDAHLNVSELGTWLTLSAHPDGIGASRIRERLEAAWTDASR